MIVIRTHASLKLGIGHLIRMSVVAREFSKLANKVILLLDCVNPEINKYVQDLQVDYLYSSNNLNDLNEEQDAQLLIRYLSDKPVELVIVDSYILSETWETKIVESGFKVIVFDDLGNRTHNCDYLIDPKWCGKKTTLERYKGLVPDKCQRFLGPKYCILDPRYRQNQKSNDNQSFNIMFSLGGGGDLNIIADLIEELLPQLEKHGKTFKLFPVVGPLAFNTDKLINLANKDLRIQLIDKPSSLYEHYLNTSLFIGALGTSLYELSSLSIPALTFSLASNQENKIDWLEDFGHFFHVSADEFQQTSLVVILIITLVKEIHRMKALRNNCVITVDGLGAKRIVESVLKGEYVQDITNNTVKNERAIKEYDYTTLSENLSIRKVSDTDINHSLDSRNLIDNKKNMTINNDIPRLVHYIWWFSNEREFYVVEHNGIRNLYIWHQRVEFNQQPYMIGGWSVCGQDSSFDIAAVALQWQLELTAKIYPNAIWIAVIKKTNKYVNLLNEYMGFEEVLSSDQEFDAIQYYFKDAPYEEYNYVKFLPSIFS